MKAPGMKALRSTQNRARYARERDHLADLMRMAKLYQRVHILLTYAVKHGGRLPRKKDVLCSYIDKPSKMGFTLAHMDQLDLIDCYENVTEKGYDWLEGYELLL